MAGFDEGNVWYSYQGQAAAEISSDLQSSAKGLFAEFIQQFDSAKFKTGQKAKYIYRDYLLEHRIQLLIDLHHLDEWNRDLSDKVLSEPTTYLPLLEAAALEVLSRHLAITGERDQLPQDGVHVQLFSSTSVRGAKTMRELSSDQVSRIVVIPGIITAASKLKHKASSLTIQCSKCKGTQMLRLKPGMTGALIPRRCQLSASIPGLEQDCPMDPFVVLPEKSRFCDQQTLKLQERPEDIPTGELPRTLMVYADRLLCGKVSPGTRVTAVGIYSAFKGPSNKNERSSTASVQQPYLKLVGLLEAAGDAHNLFDFTQEEVHEFEEFAKQSESQAELFRRIAPNIFGHENIKKALACLLMGGSRKQLPDNTWRRGDINVLLLGDPSTAKSQFLKFASKVAPIAVYTSGKGSSAAGLTASVVRDAQTREFYLEGGAMVLADNGVCCIDEFDKMRPEDRVAIHEAMEQQTISIAKAGITTMLKSRTSVLAAANPPSGRYDDLKTMAENIELQSTILSRFDLIFIVKDDHSRATDEKIAKHVLDVHRKASGHDSKGVEQAAEKQAEDFLKRFIHYCRSHCFPRLSEDAAKQLAAAYATMRTEARTAAMNDQSGQPPVPITVRQLEALVRISESLARMQLVSTVNQSHAAQALELFQASTIDALKAGINTGNFTEEQRRELQRVSSKVSRVLGIGQTRSERQVVDQLVGWGESELIVRRALINLIQEGSLVHRHERRVLQRVR